MSPGAASSFGPDASQRDEPPDLGDSDSSDEEDHRVLFHKHRDFAHDVAWRRRQRREAREEAERKKIEEEKQNGDGSTLRQTIPPDSQSLAATLRRRICWRTALSAARCL